MRTDENDSDRASAREVAALQRDWIFGWDRVEGEPARAFEEVFGRYYDFDADVLLFDDADPERRTHRRVADYADAFWPTFSALRSARHAIAEEPEVLVSGDLAAARMVFIAELIGGNGEVTRLRCYNSQVWRRADAAGWHIVRDQTAIYPISEAEVESFFG
jgi:ketosteroid isomerase-like protein